MNELDESMKRYEGAFLESADLQSRPPITMEISEVRAPDSVKAADGRLIDKPILSFVGTKKQLILCKTNVRILKAMFGPKASGWVGKKVTTGVRYLEKALGERNIPTLRIIPPQGVPIPFAARKHYGQAKPFTEGK